jgi:hypothetical protein
MKVYFAASFRGIKYYSKFYSGIYNSLEALGAKHLEKTLIHKDEEHAYRNLEKGGVEAYTQFFNQTIKHIKTADVNVFDSTMPSLGIGFQVEKSLEFNKPTVVLYLKGHLPHFIAGTNSDKLILMEYDEKTLEDVVKKAVNSARVIADKRFNFFISPSYLTYLERISQKKGLTKSAFIRQLLHDYMKKNPL